MARSKSKNKTLAVGEYVHSEVVRMQEILGSKNHDETLRDVFRILKAYELLQ
jgi:hypothetical protein